MAREQGKAVSSLKSISDTPILKYPRREEINMVKTHVKMLTTDKGADDGIHVKTYRKDKTYSLGLSLAKAFVEDRKTAEYVNPPVEEEEGEEPITDDSIDWLNLEVKDTTKAKLIAKCEELKLDPRDDSNKGELLELIQTKLKADGATWTGTEKKKSLIDKAKEAAKKLVTGGDKKDDEG